MEFRSGLFRSVQKRQWHESEGLGSPLQREREALTVDTQYTTAYWLAKSVLYVARHPASRGGGGGTQ